MGNRPTAQGPMDRNPQVGALSPGTTFVVRLRLPTLHLIGIGFLKAGRAVDPGYVLRAGPRFFAAAFFVLGAFFAAVFFAAVFFAPVFFAAVFFAAAFFPAAFFPAVFFPAVFRPAVFFAAVVLDALFF